MMFFLSSLILVLFSKDIEYTFKDLNILSSDITIEGSSPEFEFFIPYYRNLKELRLNIRLKASSTDSDCRVVAFVNDVPTKSVPCKDTTSIDINLFSFDASLDFIKFKLKIFLSQKNPCDMLYNKTYLSVFSDSKVLIRFNEINSFEYLLKSYFHELCIKQKELISLAYFININSKIPYKFSWGEKSYCRGIFLSTYNLITPTYINIDTNSIKLISQGYSSMLLGSAPIISNVGNYGKCKNNEYILSFDDIGIGNKTISFFLDGSLNFNLDTSKIGYIPKNLRLLLSINHTVPIGDKAELRLYTNGILVGSYLLKGFGDKRFDFSIPSHILNWGANRFELKVFNSVDSKYCNGSIYPLELTVFSNSYFYWDGVYSKLPGNISDFLRGLNGKVVLSIEDDELAGLVLSLFSQLPYVNQSIKEITIEKEPRDYDFLITAKRWELEAFEIYNPITNEVVFKADYNKSFVFFELNNTSSKPKLFIYAYKNPDIKSLAKSFNINDYLKIYGNFLVADDGFLTSFDIGNKMRIRYARDKSFSYIWKKYRLVFVILLGIIITIFLFSRYRKLTHRVN